MRDHASTERTFAVAQTAMYALLCMAVLAAPIAAYVPRPGGIAGIMVLLVCIAIAGAIAGVLVLGVHRLLSGVLGGVLSHATGLEGGGATRTHFAMSQVDGLIVRRQYAAAAEELRAALYAHDGETGAEIAQALADLLSFRMQAEEDAAPVYRRARRLWEAVRGARGREGVHYCTRRLLDLYESTLQNPAAADAERSRLASLVPR